MSAGPRRAKARPRGAALEADAKVAGALSRVARLATEADRAGMRRFGINVDRALGVSVTDLRRIARGLGKDHALARGLWASGIHEARILAALVEEPDRVTEAQAERWVRSFDSWDLCDQVCGNLFDRTPFAFEKAAAWAGREREFEKRAGFALMAMLAVHRRDAPDDAFLPFLKLIEREAHDGRNFVKKAVNWALRQIGKRSPRLREAALLTAGRIRDQGTPSARWIASDALRELQPGRAG